MGIFWDEYSAAQIKKIGSTYIRNIGCDKMHWVSLIRTYKLKWTNTKTKKKDQ